MNTMADLESREDKDLSKWNLNHKLFQKTCQVFLENQRLISLHLAFHVNFSNILHGGQILSVREQMQCNRIGPKVLHVFPQFCLINRVFRC